MVEFFMGNAVWLGAGVAGFVLLLVLLLLWVKNVGGTQIAVTERMYVGKQLSSGRVFALKGEVGIQAEYMGPGLHFVFWPLRRVIERENFVSIGPDEIGIVTATDGQLMPAGRIFAEDRAGDHHNNFQNPVGFLENGGVRGEQLRFLTNGQYMIHPRLFNIRQIKKRVIRQGMVGVVFAQDGQSLEAGQLVGRSVPDHETFQKAEIFLQRGGQKGPQVEILRPGTYNIHDGMFRVEEVPATVIKENEIGIVEALGGAPLPAGDVVADTPEGHNNFQDGEAFLRNGGKRGPQTAILAPGVYYINPVLFKVTPKPQLVVKQGEVAVLIANHGRDPSDLPAEEQGKTGPLEGNAKDSEEHRLSSGTKQRHIVPEGYRGIQKDVLGPGRYNINPMVFQHVIVPTTTRSMEWSAHKAKNDGSFDPFEVVSRDGFPMKVEVRCQYRVLPENAPYVIAKLGSIAEMEANVIDPQIDGIFRAQVSKSPAIAYQQERANEQKQAEEAVREDLAKYRVEVVSVMITNIHLPEKLMETTQAKNLAEQRKSMYDAQEEAEKRRSEYEKTRAQADQQGDIIRAENGILIATHQARQAEERAKGEAARIRTEADAQADAERKVGEAKAAVIEATGRATAEAYRQGAAALGSQAMATVETFRTIGEHGTKIVPENLVQGGGEGGDSTSGLVTLLLMRSLSGDGGQRALTAPAAAAEAPETGTADGGGEGAGKTA